MVREEVGRRLSITPIAAIAAIFSCALSCWGCDSRPAAPVEPIGLSATVPTAVSAPGSASADVATHPSFTVETVDVAGDLPVFVQRGEPGSRRMVFLHGDCSNGLGYIRAFQQAAAAHGTLVGVQATKPCRQNDFYYWTNTPKELNQRVETAFRSIGDNRPLVGLTVIGYSSGAVLAEMLAYEFPGRYSHVILVGGPQKPVEWRLRRTRSTVMIAGSRDRQDLMQGGARDLSAAGIPSTFLVLPGAKHGQMGPEAERVMGEALGWLWKNERSL